MNYKQKKIISWLILSVLNLFVIYKTSKADNTYPYSYSITEEHYGANLITSKTSSNKIISYLIKPNWAGEPEVINIWNGLERKNTRGSSIGTADIISAFPFEGSLFAILIDNHQIFFSCLDSNARTIYTYKISDKFYGLNTINIRWIGVNNHSIVFIVNSQLYTFSMSNDEEPKVLAGNVINAKNLNNRTTKTKNVPIAYLVSKESSAILYTVDINNNIHFLARLPYTDYAKIEEINDELVLFSSAAGYTQTMVSVIHPVKGILSTFWLDTKPELVELFSQDNYFKIAYLKYSEGRYSLNFYSISRLSKLKSIKKTDLPEQFVEPMKFTYDNSILIALFRNGITTFDQSGDLTSSDFLPFSDRFRQLPQISNYSEFIAISSATNSLLLKRRVNSFWFLNRFIANTGKIILPLLLIIGLILVIQFYRHQKRLFKEIIELPSLGIVIILDNVGRLLNLNDAAMKFLNTTVSTPTKKNFTYYFSNESSYPIKELIDEALNYKETIQRKINIVSSSGTKEWLGYVIPIRNITGNFRGLVFTGIDITEQLERNRLYNWAQLAHDMQTNLSTIRLNAEQIIVSESDGNAARRKKIINQANLLIQRVRDLVTVGRTNTIDKAIFNSFQICEDVLDEFDKQMHPNINFLNESDNFQVMCDKDKLIRALRNAVENSIRATQKENGIISLKAWRDIRFAYFSVTDNGKGIDENVKAAMLKPYFTTSKQEGGTGMGTMIMQQVIELHGGEITIKSEKNVGSEIIFSFPNLVRERISKSIKDKLFGIASKK